MPEWLIALWNSNTGKVFILSIVYSMVSILAFGGYMSQFFGGYGALLIEGVALQDIIFFLPTLVVGLFEWIVRHFIDFLKVVLLKVVLPMVIGIAVAYVLEKSYGWALYKWRFAEWGEFVFLTFWYIALWVSLLFSRKKNWKLWLAIAILLEALFLAGAMLFVAPEGYQPTLAQQSGSKSLEEISSFLADNADGVIFWGETLEALLVPLLLGQLVADTLLRYKRFAALDLITTRHPISSAYFRRLWHCDRADIPQYSFTYQPLFAGRIFVVAILKHLFVFYIQDEDDSHSMLVPASEVVELRASKVTTKASKRR